MVLNTPETWESKRNKKNSNEKQTAAQYFAQEASYILPLKENFEKVQIKDKGEKNENDTKGNTYTAKALELFKKVSQNEIVSYSDPSDFRSGKFRDAIGSNFNAIINSKGDFNKFISSFTASLGSDF